MAHVLLVDDDPQIRVLLRAVLGCDGHAVQEASDGVEALAGVRDSQVPLIVLLDWQMPRLDGFGVLHAVAAEPYLAATHRFVLVTANDLPHDQERGSILERLQVPVIQKPFDLEAVTEVVEHIAACLVAAK